MIDKDKLEKLKAAAKKFDDEDMWDPDMILATTDAENDFIAVCTPFLVLKYDRRD